MPTEGAVAAGAKPARSKEELDALRKQAAAKAAAKKGDGGTDATVETAGEVAVAPVAEAPAPVSDEAAAKKAPGGTEAPGG